MPLWKKSIVATLLTVMVYHYAGYYVICQVIEWRLEKQMEKSLLQQAPETLLEKIIYTGNEQQIHWEEKDREFTLNGQMYDVVKIKKENGKTILLCINDKKEEALIRQLSEVVNSHTNGAEKSGKPGIFKAPVDPVILDTETVSFSRTLTGQYYTRYNGSLLHPFSQILSPPPRA